MGEQLHIAANMVCLVLVLFISLKLGEGAVDINLIEESKAMVEIIRSQQAVIEEMKDVMENQQKEMEKIKIDVIEMKNNDVEMKMNLEMFENDLYLKTSKMEELENTINRDP